MGVIMWKIKYLGLLAIYVWTLAPLSVMAQTTVLCFDQNCIDTAFYGKFSNKKFIPDMVRNSALIALSWYPELKETKIIFRLRKRLTPLSSRLQYTSIFRSKKRRVYVITISRSSNSRFAQIIFSNLPFNAQIGVIGHELAHISYFNCKRIPELAGLYFKKINTKFVDRYEFNTDSACINHGLGYQLCEWSEYVRRSLKIKEWKGTNADYYHEGYVKMRQRYMNPETIKEHIARSSFYVKGNLE